MNGSTIGASAELLFTVLAALMLTIPFLLTIAVAGFKGRSWLWPLGSALVSAFVVVVTYDALMRFILQIDVSVVVLVPIGSGGVVSLVIMLVMLRVPLRTRQRSWRVIRLDQEAIPGKMEVNREGIRITEGSWTLEVPRDALIAIEREHSVVHLRWRATNGSFLAAKLLPDPSNTSQDPHVVAELIVQRMRGLLPGTSCTDVTSFFRA
jgi:hypothetical protein